MEWKDIDCTVKKKFQAQLPVKKLMLTVFEGMKGSINSDLLEKVAIVNNASYCQFLWLNSPTLLNEFSVRVYIYMCVCVCVCVRERDRQTDRQTETDGQTVEKESERDTERERVTGLFNTGNATSLGQRKLWIQTC